MRKTQFDQTVTKLKALDVPHEKAVEKTASLALGLKIVMTGMAFLVLAGLFTLGPMLVLRAEPSIPFLLFSALVAICGMFLVFMGGMLVSREAAEAAGGLFGVVAKAIRTVKRSG